MSNIASPPVPAEEDMVSAEKIAARIVQAALLNAGSALRDEYQKIRSLVSESLHLSPVTVDLLIADFFSSFETFSFNDDKRESIWCLIPESGSPIAFSADAYKHRDDTDYPRGYRIESVAFRRALEALESRLTQNIFRRIRGYRQWEARETTAYPPDAFKVTVHSLNNGYQLSWSTTLVIDWTVFGANHSTPVVGFLKWGEYMFRGAPAGQKKIIDHGPYVVDHDQSVFKVVKF